MKKTMTAQVQLMMKKKKKKHQVHHPPAPRFHQSVKLAMIHAGTPPPSPSSVWPITQPK